MKKRFKILLVASLIISFVFTNNLSKAQAFQRGTFDIDLGWGFGFYATQASITGLNVASTGHAGSSIFPISLEYGIGNRIGIGLIFTSDKYFASTDSVTHIKPDDRSNEFGVFGNYHFVITEHIDFYGGLTLGGSSITLNSNNSTEDVYTGSGTYADIHFNSRFFIGHHFAFTVGIRFPTIRYINGSFNNIFGETPNVNLTGTGWVLGIGVAFKI